MPVRTCLVIEDSPTMRQLIVFALRRVRDLQVTEADDGMAGLQRLQGTRFDSDRHRHQHAGDGRAQAGAPGARRSDPSGHADS